MRKLAEYADELTIDDTPGASSSFTGTCNYCKRTGHMAKDCPRKKRGLPAVGTAQKPAASKVQAAAELAAQLAYQAELEGYLAEAEEDSA